MNHNGIDNHLLPNIWQMTSEVEFARFLNYFRMQIEANFRIISVTNILNVIDLTTDK